MHDRSAPVGTDGSHLEAVGAPAELVGHLIRDMRRVFGRSGGHASKNARIAIGVRGLQYRIAHARVVERVAHLLDGGVAGTVERNRRAADEFNAELQAAHANNHSDEHHGDSSGAQEVLLQAQHVDIELDEAAVHVFAAFDPFLALEIRRSVFAVAHAPEAGMLRDAARREQANNRCLEQQHHRNVAQNAKRERKAEALDRCAGQEEQRERGNKRYQVGVDGGQNAVPHARDGRGAHAAAHADFLTETLERKNRRVGGHANGEHDASDTRHR